MLKFMDHCTLRIRHADLGSEFLGSLDLHRLRAENVQDYLLAANPFRFLGFWPIFPSLARRRISLMESSRCQISWALEIFSELASPF